MKIGLEIHVQLTTKTKLFCGCPNRFTEMPNVHVCDYCIGFPGSKPRLNRKAVEYAAKIGLALNCRFPHEMAMSRKSYFYPDMGKNFQITQYEMPIALEGHLTVGKKKIRITRIQIEEDPARLQHMADGEPATITTAKYVLVDYGRSGTPLCEIVTEPDFTSPQEAKQFLQNLSVILEYLSVYDPEQEGSMRIDANISLGSSRVEVKNISGFKDVERALNYEIVRQKGVMKRKQKVKRETRGWDAGAGVTRSQRSKEEEEEYGYIFEPDLPVTRIKKSELDELKKTMPEFAHEKIERYTKDFGVPEEIAVALTIEPDFAAMFESVAARMDKQLAARWFSGPIRKTLNYNNMRMRQSKLTAENIIKLLKCVKEKILTDRSAELLLREMVVKGTDIDILLASQRTERIEDESMLNHVVKEVLNENPKAIIDYKSGKQETFHFLVGQIIRRTRGRADVEVVRKLLRRQIG
jgi:aspartyl-tRNA(Asn)/glutamyl-tRNA(Gln) amidotransferase subunit B